MTIKWEQTRMMMIIMMTMSINLCLRIQMIFTQYLKRLIINISLYQSLEKDTDRINYGVINISRYIWYNMIMVTSGSVKSMTNQIIVVECNAKLILNTFIIYGYHYSYPNIFYPSLIQLEYFENMQIRITNLLKTSFLQSIMRLT